MSKRGNIPGLAHTTDEYRGVFAIIPSWDSYTRDGVAEDAPPRRHPKRKMRYEVVIAADSFLGFTFTTTRDSVSECVADIARMTRKYSETTLFRWIDGHTSERGYITPSRHLEHVRHMLEQGMVFGEDDIAEVLNNLPRRGFIPRVRKPSFNGFAPKRLRRAT